MGRWGDGEMGTGSSCVWCDRVAIQQKAIARVAPVKCPSWWNWHLASFMLMGILVELASCQFHAYGHFGGTGILPVSCLLSSGQDAHSTPIN
ncbi:MAG: hypothetical protein F6J99_30070 [Moorea sp. SIO4G3]|nr:hypothetical protein [Moorena sp. SIO4G3]